MLLKTLLARTHSDLVWIQWGKPSKVGKVVSITKKAKQNFSAFKQNHYIKSPLTVE